MAGVCFSCGGSTLKSKRFCCVLCHCCQFCSLECATIKHTTVHCQQLYYRSFSYQAKHTASFAITTTPTPGVMLDMVRFTDAIVRTDSGEGRFCCDCNRKISTVKQTENVGLGLARTGTGGFVAYMTCPKKECPRNTNYPCGVFFMCENNPNSFWGYVTIKDVTSREKDNYDMQVVCVRDVPKCPAKSKMCVMTKRDPQMGKDGIFQISFVVIAKKKGDVRYAYNEKDNKWGKQYYKREWEFIYVDSK